MEHKEHFDGTYSYLPSIYLQGELLLSNLLIEYSISDPVGEIPTGTVAFSQVPSTYSYFV